MGIFASAKTMVFRDLPTDGPPDCFASLHTICRVILNGGKIMPPIFH